MGVLPARTGPVVRAFALSIALWLAAALLVSWQVYRWDRDLHLPVKFETVLLVYSVRYLTVAILTLPIFYIVDRWPVAAARLHRIALYALGYVPFILAFATIRWTILPAWQDTTMSWSPRTFASWTALVYDTFADILFLYLALVIAAHAYAYFTRFQRQELERVELRQSLAQSELQALRAQLHPHFLFNTLQGISTLIDTNQSAAKQMLFKLAALLRAVLKRYGTDLIALSQELEFVESYLDLEMMRLGRRLKVNWQIAPEARAALLPQLLLQPLVENAVIHGVAGSLVSGWIEVEARCQEDRLHVRIRNSIGGKSEAGLGLGLKNTRARLQYLYGDDARFDFSVGPDGLAVASLELPAFVTSGTEPARCANA
jgi:LytS/YehU family sensor histidine kinase